MSKIIVVVVVVGFLFVLVVFVEIDFYVMGGYFVFDGEGVMFNVFILCGGIVFYEIFGVELEILFGLGVKDVDGVLGVQVELENQFGVYLIGSYLVVL